MVLNSGPNTSVLCQERWWSVTYLHDEKDPLFQCSCKLFESDGIPCCHIFVVMKDSMLTIFPDSMVTKRWTKDANVSRIHDWVFRFVPRWRLKLVSLASS